MDAADRIPTDLEGFTAAEAVAVLSRRMHIDQGSLLALLRELRIDRRIEYHLAAWDDLNAKAKQHHGAAWLRVHDNINRHMAAIDRLKALP